MRKWSLLTVVSTLWLTFTGVSAAGDITYNIDVPVGAGSVTGTITTDGTIGTLFTGDIVNFDLTLFDGAATATLMDGVNGGSVFIGPGSLAATFNNLTFNFNNSGTFVNFFTSPSTVCVPLWTLRTTGGTACNGVSGDVSSVQASSTTGPATVSETGTESLAVGGNPIPEPGSVALMVGGLLTLIGLRKRRDSSVNARLQ